MNLMVYSVTDRDLNMPVRVWGNVCKNEVYNTGMKQNCTMMSCLKD